MPDIHLRFHADMLVLSAPVDAALRARGHDVEAERELLLATEPETVLEPLRLELVAGAQCIVLPTTGITRARLAHLRSEDKAGVLADAAADVASQLSAQHVLAEIGPTGLPLDASSATSLKANRDQYADAARLFDPGRFDALLIGPFATTEDLRCALMGVRKVWDAPVFASVALGQDGTLAGNGQEVEWALSVMDDLGADVAGIVTDAPPQEAAELVGRVARGSSLPALVQLNVGKVCARDPYDSSPYWCADLIGQAAGILRDAGAQFLRASGSATAAYTGALVAATLGTDAVR